MGDFDISTGGKLVHKVTPDHRTIDKDEGVTIGDVVNGLENRTIDEEGATLGDIINSKDFGWSFYPPVDPEPEEKVLASFWISEGPWKLRAFAKFLAGGIGANAWLKIRAESDGQSIEAKGGPDSYNQLLCIGHTNFPEAALVSLIVQEIVGPCSISDIHFSAYREA